MPRDCTHCRQPLDDHGKMTYELHGGHKGIALICPTNLTERAEELA